MQDAQEGSGAPSKNRSFEQRGVTCPASCLARSSSVCPGNHRQISSARKQAR